MEYYIHLAIIICIYSILSQGLNLNFGLGGMFNLAHIASYAIGAYTTAIFSLDYELSFFIVIVLSAIMPCFLALLLGAISLRLTLDYFAIGTIAFSSVITALLINWKSLTRGVLGIPGIPRPEIFSYEFASNTSFLILVFSFAVMINLFLYILFKSQYSRTLRAQSEFLQATQSLAKNAIQARLVSFLIASATAGIAGSFFAYYINYIDPSSFSFQEMIFVFTIIIIGKPGSFFGNILATIFLVLLPEPLRFLDIPSSILGPMRQMLYAVILIFFVFINRKNLFPVQRQV